MIFAFRKIITKDAKIMILHKTFALGRITRLFCQSLIPSPAIGRFKSQAWNFGEDFEKRNAERIRKGVVGRMGRKAPIIPNAKLSQAKTNQTAFTAFSRDPL